MLTGDDARERECFISLSVFCVCVLFGYRASSSNRRTGPAGSSVSGLSRHTAMTSHCGMMMMMRERGEFFKKVGGGKWTSTSSAGGMCWLTIKSSCRTSPPSTVHPVATASQFDFKLITHRAAANTFPSVVPAELYYRFVLQNFISVLRRESILEEKNAQHFVQSTSAKPCKWAGGRERTSLRHLLSTRCDRSQ